MLGVQVGCGEIDRQSGYTDQDHQNGNPIIKCLEEQTIEKSRFPLLYVIAPEDLCSGFYGCLPDPFFEMGCES